MATTYDFRQVEAKWQRYWQDNSTYKWHSNSTRDENFVIDTPPPSISGQLHLGHIFSYNHTDFIARFQRMHGKNVFYPMGFDDNGLPTERLVEKKLKIRAANMSRSEFTVHCHKIVAQEEERARSLFKSIALSVDWSLEYQTISPEVCKISQLSFLDLIAKDQAYLSSEPILWDCIDGTAIAQAEVEDKQFSTHMNHLSFRCTNGDPLTIATTRPELLPACVAVFFNPEDPRYTAYQGQHAITPCGTVVPILPDEKVEIEKGTGLVMCCTFGDTTDVWWWRKHKLPLKLIIDRRGRLTTEGLTEAGVDQQWVVELQGLKITEARQKILEMLDADKLLLSKQEIIHTVKCAERSGAPLEILATKQWFIRTLPHRDTVAQLAEQLTWHPKQLKIRLDKWIESLSWDWCISRQRFFGVPIPVWYSKRPGEEGKVIYATTSQLPLDPTQTPPPGYTLDEVEPEVDVMDTWATSSVSPQINSQAINSELSVDYQRHKILFPADLRPQSHEIIRTWAFYTILKAYLHEGVLPWHNIMISGWCLAEDKSKMSKSKGNIIDPIALIEKYGADVVRYWAANSKLGVDTTFSEDILVNGKKLLNKIWNASKFILQYSYKDEQLSAQELVERGVISHRIDLWALARLAELVEKVSSDFQQFDYATANEKIERFFWHDFCDNYLEIVKTRAYGQHTSDTAAQNSAIATLYLCLKTILQLWAPILPHITEELWQLLSSSGSIHSRHNWPQSTVFPNDEIAVQQGDLLLQILALVRKTKSERNISMKAGIAKLTLEQQHSSITLTDDLIKDLMNVTNSALVVFDKVNDEEAVQVGASVRVNINFITE